jgi:hypothetical protein
LICGWFDVRVMRRIPPSLRALVLVPLLAVAVDQARATLACGPTGQSCLEAAGGGWTGAAGLALLALYSLALALGVTRAARCAGEPGSPPALARTWLTGTLGVAAVCGGQALLAGTTGDAAALGGGWLELLGFCVVAGAVLAVALRVAPAAARLVLAGAPSVPRPGFALALAPAFPALPVRPARTPRSPATAGRAPPA